MNHGSMVSKKRFAFISKQEMIEKHQNNNKETLMVCLIKIHKNNLIFIQINNGIYNKFILPRFFKLK